MTNIIEIGRMVVKIAGRDARKKGVIVDILDENTVLIDGQVRRRKCNIKHLELLDKVIDIKKGADHSVVVEIFSKEGIEIALKKPKSASPRPRRARKVKEKLGKKSKKDIKKNESKDNKSKDNKFKNDKNNKSKDVKSKNDKSKDIISKDLKDIKNKKEVNSDEKSNLKESVKESENKKSS